jgi:tetratricopeptide (TPR) repeat protein
MRLIPIASGGCPKKSVPAWDRHFRDAAYHEVRSQYMPQATRSRNTAAPARACALIACALLGLATCSREDARGTPQELITEAWKEFRLGDFDSAAHRFSSAIHRLDKEKAKGHPLADERELRINALYGLGLVGTVGREGGEAGGSPEGRRYLQQVIAMEGRGEMAAWAALALVRDEHLPQTSSDPIDIPRLRTLYRGILEKYPGSQASQEAFLYLQSLYVETLEPADAHAAIDAIEAYLASNPKAPFRSALHTLMSAANVTLKNYPAALRESIQSLETKEVDPSNPTANNILEYYRIAMMAQYDVGDFDTARKYYHRFLEEYPNDQRAFTVKLQLARMDRLEQELRSGKDPAQARGAAQ